MRILAIKVVLVCVMLGSGCSTQRYRSAQRAHVVAACIAKDWRQCLEEMYAGTITVTPTVVTKENTNGCFVGILTGQPPYLLFSVFSPLSMKHPLCLAWAEVTDTPTGSKTLYHQTGCTYSRRLDQGVRQCQEMNQ
jgi:hypothetical protein